jgi:hypothetical protein
MFPRRRKSSAIMAAIAIAVIPAIAAYGQNVELLPHQERLKLVMDSILSNFEPKSTPSQAYTVTTRYSPVVFLETDYKGYGFANVEVIAAFCKEGEIPTGGGFTLGTADKVAIFRSMPIMNATASGWVVEGYNDGALDTGIRAFVVCLSEEQRR